jgi:hypothetical protein
MTPEPGTGNARVTRDVEPAAVHDLLDDPPRAALAFIENDAASVVPAHAVFVEDKYFFAIAEGAAPELDDREVVLVIDDGPYWFELRGVSARGLAKRADPPALQAARGLAWYVIETRRVLAWDYGSIRHE